MIVGPTKSYKFNRSDRLLIPVGPVRPELTENFYLVVYRISLKLIAMIKFDYRWLTPKVLQSSTQKEISSLDYDGCARLKREEIGEYLDRLVATQDIWIE